MVRIAVPLNAYLLNSSLKLLFMLKIEGNFKLKVFELNFSADKFLSSNVGRQLEAAEANKPGNTEIASTSNYKSVKKASSEIKFTPEWKNRKEQRSELSRVIFCN